MAVTVFEVGKYYKWTGSKTDLNNWAEPMNAMLDGLPHKCTEITFSRASFEGVCGGPWDWGHVLDRITEVKQCDGTITASEAKRLVASGAECQWYDDDFHIWIDCDDSCAYQNEFKYRRKPTAMWIDAIGSLATHLKSDLPSEPKKPIKEMRRDMRKRFLGL